jgi:superfamily II DNA or RNA helicase
VLSSRVEHLETLKNGVDKLIKDANESHIYNTYYYMGKSKKGERKMAEKDGDIIFATLQLAEEGLDISRLDSIIIALPVKKEKTLLQSIGRILRNDTLTNLTQIPVVIDISDMMSIYTKWSQKRDLVYNKKKWYMQHFYWDDENFQHKKLDDKNKKPMNIMFDDILDEDFIEKNLILTEKDINQANQEDNQAEIESDS